MALTFSDVDRFEAARPRLGAIAYRLLGSASEAEDAVQETYLRWQAADVGRIEVPEAWLTKVLTNLCLNQLTSARARRETYVGQWLPEPLLEGDPMLGPAETAEQRESVSYAVMVLLERLSPNERAVYVLREAFAYSHREIAEILDLNEAASQQIFHRAKKHVAQGRARVEIDEVAVRRIVEEFLAAATSGETQPLIKLLTSDAVAVGDGGGKVPPGPVPSRAHARWRSSCAGCSSRPRPRGIWPGVRPTSTPPRSMAALRSSRSSTAVSSASCAWSVRRRASSRSAARSTRTSWSGRRSVGRRAISVLRS